MEFQIKLLH